jgi:hypothetical protein
MSLTNVHTWVAFGVFVFLIVWLTSPTQQVFRIIFGVMCIMIAFAFALKRHDSQHAKDTDKRSQLQKVYEEINCNKEVTLPKEILINYIFADQRVCDAIIRLKVSYNYIDPSACEDVLCQIMQITYYYTLCMHGLMNPSHGIATISQLRIEMMNALHSMYAKSSALLHDTRFKHLIRLMQSYTYRKIRLLGNKYKLDVKHPVALDPHVINDAFYVFL